MLITFETLLNINDIAYLAYNNSNPARVIPVKIKSILLSKNSVDYYYELIEKEYDYTWFNFRSCDNKSLCETKEIAQKECDYWNKLINNKK